MTTKIKSQSRGALYDRSNSFGWVSIALHWASAVIILAMWFIGQSISSQEPDDIAARRSLHITIGLISWVLLLARILWRIKARHPHVTGQSRRTHQIAQTTHYVMLAVLSVMMVTGPLSAWSVLEQTRIAEIAHLVHRTTAKIFLALIIVHILGALKHLMFHDDETVVRMFVPRAKQSETVTPNDK